MSEQSRKGKGGGAISLGNFVFAQEKDSRPLFFFTSVHPERGVDASHRGGQAGFVNIVDDRTLRIPDYLGNSMFNTLGNFTANPRAGLIFPDFESGRTLQLIGRPEILYDVDDLPDETGAPNGIGCFTLIAGWTLRMPPH